MAMPTVIVDRSGTVTDQLDDAELVTFPRGAHTLAAAKFPSTSKMTTP